jgi:hypothetical protein
MIEPRHRLEAYATLRRRVDAVGAGRTPFETSLEAPESNDRGRDAGYRHPSLRTEQADFRHSALQLVVSFQEDRRATW